MFPLDLDASVSKAMVSYRQEQVRASFPRKITRWASPKPRPAAPTSVTATPRLVASSQTEPPLRQQQEEKYVA